MLILSDKGLDTIAYTLLGEAANQGDAGLQAVANVIKNRSLSGEYSSNPVAVAMQPYQFSTWNALGEGGNDPVGRYSKSSAAFKKAKNIAREVFNGDLPDNTGGATFYHTKAVNPTWDDSMYTTANIGDHVFYSPSHPVPPANVGGGADSLTAFIAPTPASLSQRPNISAMAYNENPKIAEAAGLKAIDVATGGSAPAKDPFEPKKVKTDSGAPDIAQSTASIAAGSAMLGQLIADTAKTAKPAGSTPGKYDLGGTTDFDWNDFQQAMGLKATPDTKLPGLLSAEKAATNPVKADEIGKPPAAKADSGKKDGSGFLSDLITEGVKMAGQGLSTAMGSDLPNKVAGAVAQHLFDGLLSTVQGRTAVIDPILYGFQSPGTIDSHPRSTSGGITAATLAAKPGTTFDAGGYTFRVNSDHSTTNLKTGATYGGVNRPQQTAGGGGLDGSPFW